MSRDHPQPLTGSRGRENHLAQDTRAQGGAVAATTADRDDQQRDRERERPGIHGRTGDSYCSRNLNWNCYWRRSRSSEPGVQDEHSARKSTDETVQRTQSSLLWTILRCFLEKQVRASCCLNRGIKSKHPGDNGRE